MLEASELERVDVAPIARGASLRFWREALCFATLALVGLGFLLALGLDGPEKGVLAALQGRATRVLVGLAAFFVCGRIVVLRLRGIALPLFGLSLLLCLLPIVLGVGRNGSLRWLWIGGVSFQPVELLKLATVFAVAELIERRRAVLGEFGRGFCRVLLPGVAASGVLILQPDVGHAFFVISVAAAMLVVAGVRLVHVVGLVTAGVLSLFSCFQLLPHVRARFSSFVAGDPGLQIDRALDALRGGSLFGVGPGAGWYQMGYLPEARNDFVFAILGNELGLVGSLLVLGLFVLLFKAAFELVRASRDRFTFFVGLGLTLNLAVQVGLNLLGVTHTIPEKGIDLCFLSSGGTNLVFVLASVGILANLTSGGARRSRARSNTAVVSIGDGRDSWETSNGTGS